METYLGASVKDNVSDDVALAVMHNTVVNMRRLLKDINNLQAHQIKHRLGTYTDCNHGQGLAVIHPAYYRHIMKDAPEKFTQFAKEVFGTDTAEAGVDAPEDFIRECGLPTKMSQLKSTVEITPEVLRQVADTCNIIKCNPRELDRKEIYQILMNVCKEPDSDFVAEAQATLYYVSVDTQGEIGWESGTFCKTGRPDAHVIEVLTEQTPAAYRAYLRKH